MYFLGQVNNKFEELTEKIIELDLFCETIIQLGNFCLLDLEQSKADFKLINLNTILNKRQLNLKIIRGNHDNPNLFNQMYKLLSNIELIKDFTVLNLGLDQVLLYGGGISTDRVERNKAGLYWESEKSTYPFSKANDFLEIRVLATHKPPPYIFDGVLDNFIDYWVKGDACLENQLSKERDEARRFINKIKNNNNIEIIISSHLNISAEKNENGIKFISLKELEFYKL